MQHQVNAIFSHEEWRAEGLATIRKLRRQFLQQEQRHEHNISAEDAAPHSRKRKQPSSPAFQEASDKASSDDDDDSPFYVDQDSQESHTRSPHRPPNTVAGLSPHTSPPPRPSHLVPFYFTVRADEQVLRLFEGIVPTNNDYRQKMYYQGQQHHAAPTRGRLTTVSSKHLLASGKWKAEWSDHGGTNTLVLRHTERACYLPAGTKVHQFYTMHSFQPGNYRDWEIQRQNIGTNHVEAYAIGSISLFGTSRFASQHDKLDIRGRFFKQMIGSKIWKEPFESPDPSHTTPMFYPIFTDDNDKSTASGCTVLCAIPPRHEVIIRYAVEKIPNGLISGVDVIFGQSAGHFSPVTTSGTKLSHATEQENQQSENESTGHKGNYDDDDDDADDDMSCGSDFNDAPTPVVQHPKRDGLRARFQDTQMDIETDVFTQTTRIGDALLSSLEQDVGYRTAPKAAVRIDGTSKESPLLPLVTPYINTPFVSHAREEDSAATAPFHSQIKPTRLENLPVQRADPQSTDDDNDNVEEAVDEPTEYEQTNEEPPEHEPVGTIVTGMFHHCECMMHNVFFGGHDEEIQDMDLVSNEAVAEPRLPEADGHTIGADFFVWQWLLPMVVVSAVCVPVSLYAAEYCRELEELAAQAQPVTWGQWFTSWFY